MGVFIGLELSNSLTQKKWLPVYEKSLFMAQKFNLYERREISVHNENVICVVPTEEREENGSVGWGAEGDLLTRRNAEYQYMPKFLKRSAQKNGAVDILVSELWRIETDIDHKNYYSSAWGNKTQGEPYHIMLLAIGCMIENELGSEAMVSGDITYGQCARAVQLASELLGKEIQLPIRCRADNLCRRIRNIKLLNEIQKLSLIVECYLGEINEDFGKLLVKYFSKDIIADYWKSELKKKDIRHYGFSDVMRNFFQSGFSLEDFCEYADFDKKDPKECKQFIEKILDSCMYIPEKDCSDILDLSKKDHAYGAETLLASFLFRWARNKAIDRYISIDETAKTFEKHFGKVISVKETINDYFKAKENDKPEKDPAAMLHKSFDQQIDKMKAERDNYEITSYLDLMFYKRGWSISPRIEEGIRASFAFYTSCSDTNECKRLMSEGTKEMFHYLAARFKYNFLTQEQWTRIYNKIRNNKNNFTRYYPMVKVECDHELRFLLHAFITDDDFWKYCKENFS